MLIGTKKFRNDKRLQRKVSIRKRISGSTEKPRISVFKSTRFTYAQVISDETGLTLAAVSTSEPEVQAAASELKLDELKRTSCSTKSYACAMAAGLVLGRRMREKGIETAVFDRNGYVYHGRVQALADGARKSGVKF
jgi:large subunit ribosomal protein L18